MERIRRSAGAAACGLIALGLAACGGGGGGSSGGTITPPTSPPPANPPPSGNVAVSGKITFDRPTRTTSSALNFDVTERLPVRGVTVEVLRSSDLSVLATTVTDGQGDYSATVPSGSLVLRAKAQMRRTGSASYDFEVRDNTAGNALYAIDSQAVSPSSSSVTVNVNARTGYSASTRNLTGQRESAPFAILDMIWRAKELVQQAEPGLALPAVDVFWSTRNSNALPTACFGDPNPQTGEIGTSFYIGGDVSAARGPGCATISRGIYVLGDSSGDLGDDLDEFDPSVIAHEFGHYYEDAFSRSDSMGGPHSLSSRLDMTLAFSEGWGNAFQGFVLEEGFYRDAVGTAGRSGFGFTLEADATRPFVESVGFYSESSVMDFLWDIYDSVDDGGDSVSLGFAPIHRVMREDMRGSAALTTIYVMATGLAAQSPASEAGIRQRLSRETISGFGEFGDGESAVAEDAEAVPVYRTVAFGVPQTIVSTARFADPDFPDLRGFNRLGARRYFRIDVSPAGRLNVVAQGAVGTDPDFNLLRNGIPFDQSLCPAGEDCDGENDSLSDGREAASYPGLAAGTYVLEVYDCSNLGASCRDTPGPGERSITVTVTRP
jgi:hypothetical protein